jgi:hypothetical protein
MGLSLDAFKGISLVGTFLTGLCGLLVFPLRARTAADPARQRRLLARINAFAAGVFLSVGLLHMLPDAIDSFAEATANPLPPCTNITPRAFAGADDGSDTDDDDSRSFPWILFTTASTVLLMHAIESFLVILVAREFVRSTALPGSAASRHAHSPGSAGKPAVPTPGTAASISNINDDRAALLPRAASDLSLATVHPADASTHSYGTDADQTARSATGVIFGSTSAPEDAAATMMHLEAASRERHSARRATLLAVLLIVTLSVHSAIEGLALGLQTSLEDVGITLVSIIAHKGVAAFALGSSFLKSKLPHATVVFLLIAFAAVTPTGIGIGMGLSSETTAHSAASSVIIAVAAGTFFYIAVVLFVDSDSHGAPSDHGHESEAESENLVHEGLVKLALAALGFAIMAVAAIWS